MKLVEHLGELARWPLVGRVRAVLLGHIAFFSVGFGLFTCSAFLRNKSELAFGPELGTFPVLVAAGTAVCLLFFFIGSLMKQRWPESRAYTTFAAIALLVFDALIFIEIGMFSSLTWLSIIGVAAVLFALFEQRTVWLTLLVMLAVLALYSVFIARGELPYRDLLSVLTGNSVKVSVTWLVVHWLTTGPIAIFGIWILGALLGGWHKRERRFESASVTDPLTRVFNRRRFMEQLEQLCKSERADESQFAVAIFDLDHFKKINDSHGHAVGDLALQTVANVMKETLRDGDLIARYGGEEFAALLPGCDAERACFIADRCRQAIESQVVLAKASGAVLVTTSVGVCAAGHHGFSAEELLAEADKALYEAKEAGRNRTVLANDKLQ